MKCQEWEIQKLTTWESIATWAKPLRLPQRRGYVSSLNNASRTPPGEIPNRWPFFKARTHSSWGPWITLNTSNSNLKPGGIREDEREQAYSGVGKNQK